MGWDGRMDGWMGGKLLRPEMFSKKQKEEGGKKSEKERWEKINI